MDQYSVPFRPVRHADNLWFTQEETSGTNSANSASQYNKNPTGDYRAGSSLENCHPSGTVGKLNSPQLAAKLGKNQVGSNQGQEASPFPAPLHVPHPAQNKSPEPIHSSNRLEESDWALNIDYSAPSSCGSLNFGSDDQAASRKADDTDWRGYQGPNIGSWASNPVIELLHDPLPAIKEANSHHCEIDPNTGSLLSVQDYPDTYVSPAARGEKDKDLTWRQMNMTSALRITYRNEQRNERKRQVMAQMIAAERHEARARAPELDPEPESLVPLANCTLRPATVEDSKEIANIINLERQASECPQILESKDISEEQVNRVLEDCRMALRPFIVAVDGAVDELLDRSKWPANSTKAYMDYVKFKQSQPQKTASIVGFAFVTENRVGFLHTPCPGSRHSGQIRVVVHPDHRRNHYGSALLDKILMVVAPYHNSLLTYKWDGPTDSDLYSEPALDNRRQYNRVLIEAFVENESNSPKGWRAKMLDDFEFKRVAYFEKMVKTDRDLESKWLDLAVWERIVETKAERIRRISAAGCRLPY